MIETVKQKFIELFKNLDNTRCFFSPGRVNIIGEHIDYNGGLVLPCAIDRGTYFVIRLNNTNMVNVYSMQFEDLGVGGLDKEFTKNYEKGLSLYLNGAWTLALDYFKNANQIVPTDKASRLMIERCQEFIKNPPSDWNGAIALTSK